MIFDLKEVPMLLELLDKRDVYGTENHEVRVYKTPEELNIMVTRLQFMGQPTYYCTFKGQTMTMNGECFWGQGLEWEQALKLVEINAQKLHKM